MEIADDVFSESRAGWCVQGDCPPLFAVGLTEVPKAEELLQLLFQIPDGPGTKHQWHCQNPGNWHVSLLKHPNYMQMFINTAVTHIPDSYLCLVQREFGQNCLNSVGKKEVSEILSAKFTYLRALHTFIKNANQKMKYVSSEKGCRVPEYTIHWRHMDYYIFFHVMSRLIPDRSTKAPTKSTPTWAQIFSQGNGRDTWANKLEADSQRSYVDFLGPLRGSAAGVQGNSQGSDCRRAIHPRVSSGTQLNKQKSGRRSHKWLLKVYPGSFI